MGEPLETSVMNKISLEIFGIPVLIEANSLRFIETMRHMYQRLEVSEFENLGDTPLEVTLVTGSSSPAINPALIVDGKVWPHQDEKSLEDIAYEVVLSQALARVQTHFLIHAAVVSLNDKGLVIAAESGHGKTTLAIKLLLNGFQYLSDEIAAFGRSDRLIRPFPRALRVKPGTLDLLGLEYLKDSAALWGDKLLLDVESIRAGSLGAPASISHIIIVRDSQTVNDEEYKRELGVLVNQLDENLLSEFREIEGVETVWQEQVLGYPLIRFRCGATDESAIRC